MLYVTTRTNHDAFTVRHALEKSRGSDGGFYLPFRMPHYDAQQLDIFAVKTIGEGIAEILNCFFPAGLSAWDVDFAIGRNPIKLVTMSHKIMVAECWHNTDADISRLIANLSDRVGDSACGISGASSWTKIAIRIAVLFAVYGEILRQKLITRGQLFDIAVSADDFSILMSAYYARSMGLPVGAVLCGCREEGDLWRLLYQGQLAKSGHADLGELERLLYDAFGCAETLRCLDYLSTGKTYQPDPAQLTQLRKVVCAAVVSRRRQESVIRNVFKSSAYLLEPAVALAYGALQDHRAVSVGTRPALLLSDVGYTHFEEDAAKVLGIPVQQLSLRLSER